MTNSNQEFNTQEANSQPKQQSSNHQGNLKSKGQEISIAQGSNPDHSQSYRTHTAIKQGRQQSEGNQIEEELSYNIQLSQSAQTQIFKLGDVLNLSREKLSDLAIRYFAYYLQQTKKTVQDIIADAKKKRR
jgi:hypothetical protein